MVKKWFTEFRCGRVTKSSVGWVWSEYYDPQTLEKLKEYEAIVKRERSDIKNSNEHF